VLNHAPDLRKNESLSQDARKLTASASDKAARYFTDLQHLRKKFWERYRHLLIPMIRTRIENSGGKRLTRTATSHGLRQTKRSYWTSTRSAVPFGIKSPNTNKSKTKEIRRRSWFPGFGFYNQGIRLYKKSMKLDNPNGPYPFDKLVRLGKSSQTTNSEGEAHTLKNRKLPKNMKEENPSMLHFIAYSLLRK
jgi:hypothetical protein